MLQASRVMVTPAYQFEGILPMRLSGSAVSFGRHESFPLRFGWIAKGLAALDRDPGLFTPRGRNRRARRRQEHGRVDPALAPSRPRL